MPKPMTGRVVLACMTGQSPLPSVPWRGAYAVTTPRHTDAVAKSLRAAYREEKMPPEWLAMLDTLDRR